MCPIVRSWKQKNTVERERGASECGVVVYDAKQRHGSEQKTYHSDRGRDQYVRRHQMRVLHCENIR